MRFRGSLRERLHTPNAASAPLEKAFEKRCRFRPTYARANMGKPDGAVSVWGLRVRDVGQLAVVAGLETSPGA
jgi:hypothetical protein